MTLNLVILRPEFFQLFGFFVLLRYGTGNLVKPVAEFLTVTHQNEGHQKGSHTSVFKGYFFSPAHKSENGSVPTAGPNHAVSALCMWAVLWSLLCSFLLFYSPLHTVFLGGCFQKDEYSLQQCGILFLTAAFVLSVSLGWQKAAAICHTEYIYQAMQAQMGQHLQIIATDLMSVYLCLELQSFSQVVLCGLNSKSAYSLEAAMKYFQLSAFRSCQLLQGVGFIYWQRGETNLSHIENQAYRTRTEPSLLLLLGIWLVTTGFQWKQATAPLHFWVPDVYMGAWSSVSLWITVLPKIAVLGFWTHHWHSLWRRSFGNAQAQFRGLSMIVGAFAPLAQTNLKRLLAYSSIGHMGLLLMPQCSTRYGSSENLSGFFSNTFTLPGDSVGAQWTHMFIYIVINLGVWGLIMWPMVRPHRIPRTNLQPFGEKQKNIQTSSSEDKEVFRSLASSIGTKASGPQYIWDLKGLNQSSARAAFRWAVFMTSQAGLPPVYGFQGKAGILWSSLNNGLQALVAIALRTTLVGSVYYLKVLKVCYVDNPTSWRTYGKYSSLTAYIVAISVAFLLIGLWHGNSQFQFTHILALKVLLSILIFYFFLLFFYLFDSCTKQSNFTLESYLVFFLLKNLFIIIKGVYKNLV